MAGAAAAQIYDQLKKTPKAADNSFLGFINSIQSPDWLSAFTQPFVPAYQDFTKPYSTTGEGILNGVAGVRDIGKGLYDLSVGNPGNYLSNLGQDQQGYDWYKNLLGAFVGPENAQWSLETLRNAAGGNEIDTVTGAAPRVLPPLQIGISGGQQGGGTPSLPPISAPALAPPDLTAQAQMAFGVPPMPPTRPELSDNGLNDILMGLAAGGAGPNGPHQLGSLLYHIGLSALAGTEAAAHQNRQRMEQFDKDMQQYTNDLGDWTTRKEQALGSAMQQEFTNQMMLNQFDYQQRRDNAAMASRGEKDKSPLLQQLATLDPQGMLDALIAIDPMLTQKIATELVGGDTAALSGIGLDPKVVNTIMAGRILGVLTDISKDDPYVAQVLANTEALVQARALAK